MSCYSNEPICPAELYYDMMSSRTFATRDEILEQMDYHRRALIDLAYNLNSFCSVSRLPDELLCRIFEDYRDATSKIKPFGFVRISHVCRYWRNLAIRYTPLWSCIKISKWTRSYLKVEEQLKRSGTSPLSVEVDMTDVSDKRISCLRTIFNEFERIQHFDFTFDDLAPVNDLLFAQQAKPSILTSIRLSRHSRDHSDDTDVSRFPSWSISYLTKLTTEQFTLRELPYFCRPTVRWFDYTFCDIPSHPIVDPNLHDLFATLKKMPTLEYVSIYTQMPEDALTISTPPKSLSLPSLKVLSISESTWNIIHILDVLTVQLQVLKIHITESKRDPKFDTMISHLASSMKATLGQQCHSIEKETGFNVMGVVCGYHNVSFSAWNATGLQTSDVLHKFSIPLEQGQTAGLTISAPLPPHVTDVKTFSDIIRFTSVRILNVRDELHYMSVDAATYCWTGIIASMPNLETLFLDSQDAQFVATALDKLWEVDEAFRIRKLVLKSRMLHNTITGDDMISLHLRRRAEIGIRVEQLVMEDFQFADLRSTIDVVVDRIAPYVGSICVLDRGSTCSRYVHI
ncbi:hypothetical protein ABKN59_003292 [Abortiporus biennis]